MRLLVATVVLLASLVAAAPVGAGTAPATLRADVAEWSIVPSAGVVHAGRVRIVVRNLGNEPHELIVVRTRRFAQVLPLRGVRAVARPLATPVLVAPGTTTTVDVTLAAGSYLLLDNLPWHYWKGTSVAFSAR